MTEAGRNRVVRAPSHPGFTTTEGPRSGAESLYGFDLAKEVIRKFWTLPYGEFVEIPNFAVNPARVPVNGRYNNRGDRRDSSGNYQSYNDITWLRDRVRNPWKRKFPDETIHISWPEDDESSRLVLWNPDGQTVRVRFIRCDRPGCRRKHEGML